MIDYSGLKIYLFYGRKGSGKSLFHALLISHLIDSYYRTERRYPQLKKRKVYINQKLSLDFENQELHKHFEYWTNPEELYSLRDSDITWDEIGKDLPAGDWANTPKQLRQVFSHLRKRGNRLFANTQVYEDIDVAFRRQVDYAYRLRKLIGNRDISASLPNPKWIWGIITYREFDPMLLENERDETKRDTFKRLEFLALPHFFFIRKKYVNLYDTQAELPAYQPDKLREIVMVCREGDKCKKKDALGRPHMIIKHEPV